MLESSKILFSVSILLAISLSACHVVKRKAPDGQLYVFSSRVGCESVKSESPCTLTWQLNPYIAKVYKQSNDIVASTTELYKSRSINNDCIQAVENILCSQAVPKCSLEDGSRDYGDVFKLCQDIYNKCPQSVVNSLKQRNFCQSLKTGKHPNSPCVAPSLPVSGACPQPKFKMPLEFLADYRRKSAGLVQSFDNLQNLRYDNGERVFSSECIILLEEISCSPLYCSVNETKLLIKHDRDDCYNIIKECYEDALSKLAETSTLTSYIKSVRANLQAQCDTYPIAATAQLQAEPPLLSLLHHTAPTTQQLKDTTTNPPPSTTPRQRNIPDKQDEKSVNRISNSAGSLQFGHYMVLVAVIASFIVKFYTV